MTDPKVTKLKAIMRRHNLTCAKVAELVSCKEQTVRAWRAGQNPVPDYVLRLLSLELS
jgi:DNA-binding transcriptional regulator YiaG